MLTEKKYIIVKKYGKIKHFIFPRSLFHDTFARDNGFDIFSEVLETGALIDGRAFIITCKDTAHAKRREYRQNLPAHSVRARELESLYTWGKQYRIKSLPIGD